MSWHDDEIVAQAGEFALIALIQASLTEGGSRVEVGIGDDAAAWRPGVGMAGVVTTDTLVDRVHFRLEWTDWRSLGHKALAVNLSDIAAMGASPVLATVTLGLVGDERVADVLSLYAGMGELAGTHGVAIAGGDIVRSPQALFLSVTVIGEAEPGRLLTRSGARPGDATVVSGTIGASAAGLALLEGPAERRLAATAPLLIGAHLRPNPRIALGKHLHAAGVSAAMDLSDGLLGDLPKMLAASGVSAELWVDELPVLPAVRALFPDEASEFALRGGEDYELLLTVPVSRLDALVATAERVGASLTRIGTVRERSGDGPSIEAVDRGGARWPIAEGAFDHFAG